MKHSIDAMESNSLTSKATDIQSKMLASKNTIADRGFIGSIW